MQHVRFNLRKGIHEKLTEAREVCVTEAAILMAGYEYRAVRSAKDCPESFSRYMVSCAIALNEMMPDDLRQELLTPFILKLADTAGDEVVEHVRGEFIAEETCRRIISLYCDDVLKLPRAAERCRNAREVDEASQACWAVLGNDRSNGWMAKPSNRAAIACMFARDGLTGQALGQVRYVWSFICRRSRKRQEKYFPIAAQILDEAIRLGDRA